MKQNSNAYLNSSKSKNTPSLVSLKPKSKNPQENSSPIITPLFIGVQPTPAKLE
jgi:hypothetical protein